MPLIITLLAGIVYLMFFSLLDYNTVMDPKILLFSKADHALFGLPATINLPFSISRLWDLPLIFSFTFLIGMIEKSIEKSSKEYEHEEDLESILIGTIAGIGTLLIFFPFIHGEGNLSAPLLVGIILMILAGLGMSLRFKLKMGLIAIFTASIIITLGAGIFSIIAALVAIIIMLIIYWPALKVKEIINSSLK